MKSSLSTHYEYISQFKSHVSLPENSKMEISRSNYSCVEIITDKVRMNTFSRDGIWHFSFQNISDGTYIIQANNNCRQFLEGRGLFRFVETFMNILKDFKTGSQKISNGTITTFQSHKHKIGDSEFSVYIKDQKFGIYAHLPGGDDRILEFDSYSFEKVDSFINACVFSVGNYCKAVLIDNNVIDEVDPPAESDEVLEDVAEALKEIGSLHKKPDSKINNIKTIGILSILFAVLTVVFSSMGLYPDDGVPYANDRTAVHAIGYLVIGLFLLKLTSNTKCKKIVPRHQVKSG